MKIIVALLLIAMPVLLQAQKNKKINDTKVVIMSSETMSQSKALFILNGVIQPNDSINNPDSMNPDNIESINVVKGEQAILQYGEAGKNGVILVTTKTPVKKEPLYILDGVKIKSIVGLNSDDIESIHVLKGKESTSEYGNEGEAGVVLISTKSSKKQHRK